MNPPCLLPAPQQCVMRPGHFKLKEPLMISLDLDTYELGQVAQLILHEYGGVQWNLSANPSLPQGEIGLSLTLNPFLSRPEGYQLTVHNQLIELEAHDKAGMFYGLMTLKQLLRQSDQLSLNCLMIQDWPDFPKRGLLLDISTPKVPTLQTFFQMVDLASELKLNQIQLYSSCAFAYHEHTEVWAKHAPLSSEDVLQIDAYCKARFIEWVPYQNSFSHLHPWLKNPDYQELAEKPDGHTLCPLEPRVLPFLNSLYQELLPHFSSAQFNIGFQQSKDMGKGRSKETCRAHGQGRVFLAYLKDVHHLVRRHGKTPHFWSDMLLQHPDLMSEIPRPAVVLNTQETGQMSFSKSAHLLKNAGLPFYMCPETSVDLTLGGNTQTALDNLKQAAEYGLQFGAMGYMILDWGRRGHWQPLSLSYLPLAYGAGLSWSYHTNEALNLSDALNIHVFQDSSLVLGRWVHELGQVSHLLHNDVPGSSALFHLLSYPHIMPGQGPLKDLTFANLQATKQQLEELVSQLPLAQSKLTDSNLLQEEFELAVALMNHACRLGTVLLQTQVKSISEMVPDIRKSLLEDLMRILKTYKRVWLERFRSGGLPESLGGFGELIRAYETTL